MSTMKHFMDIVMEHSEQPNGMCRIFLFFDLCPYCSSSDYTTEEISNPVVNILHLKKCLSCLKTWKIIYNSDGGIEEVLGDDGFPLIDL